MATNGNGPDARDGYRWIRADLHIHTPASEDYAEPHVTYLEILQEAERRELEIIAFTDHNSVHGYEQMRQDIDFLQTLERAQRLTEEEQIRRALEAAAGNRDQSPRAVAARAVAGGDCRGHAHPARGTIRRSRGVHSLAGGTGF